MSHQESPSTSGELHGRRSQPDAVTGEEVPWRPEEPSDDPAGSSGDEEVTVQEEVVPQLALSEANGDDTQPAPQASEPEIPVVVPTIVVSLPLDPSFANKLETAWKQGITDKDLAHKLPRKPPSPMDPQKLSASCGAPSSLPLSSMMTYPKLMLTTSTRREPHTSHPVFVRLEGSVSHPGCGGNGSSRRRYLYEYRTPGSLQEKSR
ncbi:hypothetical protein HHI36_023753 [Cryptolaemus montrouzieri]|uniref:Uncharacterized protein n=1 Tax=Cryptolaemus montrouzieri TaxID=559131 RepID=A0ABD2PI36_9CUCU